MANRGGFSWKRATGVTRAKQRISRKTGIPLTKSGRQRKVGKMVTGGGCLLPSLVIVALIAVGCGGGATPAPVAPFVGNGTAAPASAAPRATALATEPPAITKAPSTPTPAPVKATPTPAAAVYYANCTDARAAGAAPIYRGQPGYRSALDRDGDGIACE